MHQNEQVDIQRHKDALRQIKETLDEQSALMENMRAELKGMGIDVEKAASISLDSLSSEDRERLLSFQREIREIDSILKPEAPKAAKPMLRRRNMI